MLEKCFWTSISLFFLFFSNNVYAEYYLVHALSEPLPACTPCPSKNKPIKYSSKHSRNRYSIEIYYVYDPFTIHPCASPPPSCCYERMRHRIKSPNYVNFSYEPTSYYRTIAHPTEYDSYDMRTADDDAMRYPDVNNQY